MNNKREDEILSTLYFNPKESGAFSGLDKFYTNAKKYGKSKTSTKKWLQTQDVYTLHRPVRRRFKRNRVITGGALIQFDIDLCDVGNLSKYNDGVNFLLIIVDCFSRYVWIEPCWISTGETGDFEESGEKLSGWDVTTILMEGVVLDEIESSYISTYFEQLLTYTYAKTIAESIITFHEGDFHQAHLEDCYKNINEGDISDRFREYVAHEYYISSVYTSYYLKYNCINYRQDVFKTPEWKESMFQEVRKIVRCEKYFTNYHE